MIDEILNANGNLYQTILPEEDIVLRYRLLSLKEYNVYKTMQMNGILNNEECFMNVFERCFLGNINFLSDNLPAGILISIGRLIMWLSGDSDNITLMEDIERHRQMSPGNTVYSYMQSAIVTAMPFYSIEKIESYDRESFLRLFTIAENILEKQRENYTRLTLEKIDPNKKVNKTKHGIDFDAENKAIRKHQNPYDLDETEKKLSKEQLQKLNKARR